MLGCYDIVLYISIVTTVWALTQPTVQLENSPYIDDSVDHSSSSSNGENGIFLSTYSTRGRRKKMEDFFVSSQDCCFAGVFDGHGGAKVSKFIKQTLYSNFLQLMPENKTKWTDEIVYSGLKEAVKKVDFEVTKIRKWDRQGSTVAAVYINRSESEGESKSDSDRDSESSLNDSKKDDYHSDDDVENENDNEEEEDRAVKQPTGMKSYSILTVNVGDSRVVLARSRRAIDLTSDHKPNLRSEKARIKRLGGTVRWHGLVHAGKRVKGTGVYRVNRNLSLSRAVGDRAERPCVTSDAELRNTVGHPATDEFVILATDGLWDVLSSQQAVSFLHQKIRILNKEGRKLSQRIGSDGPRTNSRFYFSNSIRHKLTKLLVLEALRRGSSDNITVTIQWLK